MERNSDINDSATDLEIESKEFTVAGIREAVKRMDTTNPSGKCLYCDDLTGADKRWCSVSCRDEWSREND